jgi:transposase-like protein
MARPKTHNKAVCQNKHCSFFRLAEGKDITKQGKNPAGHQRYLCKHCRVVFVETKGTPLYNRKLTERKIKAICEEIVETGGIRSTERKVHVHRDTITRIVNALGEHALTMTTYLVHDLGLSTYEVDELWGFIKKNRKGLSKSTISSLDQARQLLQQL